MALVAAIGTPGLFLAPVITSLIGRNLTSSSAHACNSVHRLTLGAARPFLRVGFPLGILAEVYWAYRLVGSSSIAIASSSAVLGIYTFAAAPVAVATSAIGGIQAVLLPTIWRELEPRCVRSALGSSR